MLNRSFPWRHARTRHDLARHAEVADRPRLTVAIAGATGLLGTHLRHFLTTGGHRVLSISRGAQADIRWDPVRGVLDAASLDGVDAVVNLAGRGLADSRWSESVKRELYDSRIRSTRLLADTLAAMNRPPRVLISASAVGYYPSSLTATYDEAAPSGTDFLATLCRDWEAACEPARQSGIRVVNLRIGVVLTGWGGALKKMLLPFSLGLGGPVGNGRQWLSWIAFDDLISVIYRALGDDRLQGPVNAASPHPVTNGEFTRTLGRVLRRPARLPLPAAAVALLFGEMGRSTLLASQQVTPKALQDIDFRFTFPELEAALRFELGAV